MLTQILQSIESTRHQSVNELKDLLRIPSVSTNVATQEVFASAAFYDVLDRTTMTAQQGPNGSFDLSPSNPSGQTLFTMFGYDSRGNKTNLIDPKRNTTIWQYDGANRQLRTMQHLRTGGSGSNAIYDTVTTTNNYDANSRVIRLIDDNGGTTTWNYDTLDRQVLMTFHDGSTRASLYDEASDLTQYTDENGSVFNNLFDVLGRKTAVAISPAANVLTGTQAQTFQYDGTSRLTFARDTAAGLNADASFTFDSLGRIVEEGQTYSNDTRYVTHDAFASIPATDVMYPNNPTAGRQIGSAYDALYRRTSVIETSGPSNIATWQFFGNRTATVTLANGLTCSFMNNAGTNSAVQTGVPLPGWTSGDFLGYDGSGRMIAKRFSTGAGLVVGFTTAYDPASNKLFERALHAESRSALYPAYDSMNRLLEYQRGVLAGGGGSITTPITLLGTYTQRTYNLDDLGNWKNTVYTPVGGSSTTEIRQHNKLNEINQFGSTAVSYDHGNNTGTPYPNRGNGNIAADGTRTYYYDALNRVVAVLQPGSLNSVAAYIYDALGRRVLKYVFHGGIHGGIANALYRYIYDGQQIIEEGLFGGAYTALRQFVWGQYIDELIQINVPSNNTTPPLMAGQYYPLQDLLYRTTATTDSSGSIFEAYDYDAYGNTLMFSAPAGSDWWAYNATTTMQPMCEYLFTGRQYDPETEIYWYRARYYGASIARFIGRDPIRYLDGLNLYEYAKSNPLVGTDPHGTTTYSCECTCTADFPWGPVTSTTTAMYINACRCPGHFHSCCKDTCDAICEALPLGWQIAFHASFMACMGSTLLYCLSPNWRIASSELNI